MENVLGLLLTASMYLIVPVLGGLWLFRRFVAPRSKMLSSEKGAGKVIAPLFRLVCVVCVLGIELLVLTGVKNMF